MRLHAKAAGFPASGAGFNAGRISQAVLRFLDNVIGAVAVVALVSLVAIVLANVVARYGFSTSFIGALEAARWLFILVILLGVPLAHRMRSHLAITFIVEFLPSAGQRFVGFLASFVIAYTTILLMFGGTTLMSLIGGTNVTLHLPQWTPYLAIPVSCSLGLVYLALRGFDEGRDRWEGPLAIAASALFFFFLQDPAANVMRQFDPVWAMTVAFIVTMALGTPVSFAMLFSALMANMAGNILPPAAVVQNMVNGSSKFLMLAIPFFILAGALMNVGGLTQRLMAFATALVGHMRGGLAQVNIVSSGLYAGVSGSSYSDAALGTKLLVP